MWLFRAVAIETQVSANVALRVKDAVGLEEESYQAWMACVTPEAVDGWWQLMPSVLWQFWGQKLRWEEFMEAMEEDCQLASKMIWQTVRCLRWGNQSSAITIYSRGGELLTST